MFRLLLHKSIHSCCRTSDILKLYILRLQQFSSSSREPQKSISRNGNHVSLTAQYLMNEYGISPKKAVYGFQVVSFFKNQGFTDSQILKLIGYYPKVLTCKIEKTIAPKIDFFRSKGASTPDLARIVLGVPQTTLSRSLESHIVPSYNYIKDFLGSDEDAIFALQGRPRILQNIQSYLKPNIELLHGAGMPYPRIAYLLKHRPFMFIKDGLKEYVKRVQKMGMDPSGSSFSTALTVLTSVSESKWSKKMEAYKRWGCSEEEVLTSFKKLPWIMMISEEKIDSVISFFVNEVGWEPSEVVKRYFMFTLSMNKRIIPRWSVYRELLSKGLVNGEDKITQMFQIKEDLFLKKYVHAYKNEAPSLLKLYLEKLEASK